MRPVSSGSSTVNTVLPGLARAFDRAVVLRDERLRDGEAEPAAAFAAGDQRIEDLVADGLRHAGAVVLHGDRERQPMALARERHAARNARDEPDRRIARRARHRLRGVAHDVEERLRELLGIGVEIGQADVEVAHDRGSPGTPPARRPSRARAPRGCSCADTSARDAASAGD